MACLWLPFWNMILFSMFPQIHILLSLACHTRVTQLWWWVLICFSFIFTLWVDMALKIPLVCLFGMLARMTCRNEKANQQKNRWKQRVSCSLFGRYLQTNSHTIHGTGMFTYIQLIFVMANVGTYSADRVRPPGYIGMEVRTERWFGSAGLFHPNIPS